MGKNIEYNWKCGEDGCNVIFQENDILYQCEKCEDYFCFKCFCKNHFEKHSNWKSFKVENGELKPL